MLGKMIGKLAAEILTAPFEAVEEIVTSATEVCTCRKHKWDPECAVHGRRT